MRTFLSFAAAVTSLIVVFASSGAPIPLYERYRETEPITTAGLSLAAVSYFVAVLFSLVVCGRLSNHLGRRPVALATVVLACMGTAMLLSVHSLVTLASGRALQGLACGLASSVLTSFIIETAPRRPQWLGTVAAASGPLLGLTIGAVGVGALAEYAPTPRQLGLLVAVALLCCCAVGLVLSSEPVRRTPGAMASLRPRVAVPAAALPLMPAAAAIFIATWSLGGFYQAFSPTVTAVDLGSQSVFVASVVFASFMAPNAFGGPLTGSLEPVTVQRWGIALFALAAVTLTVALALHAIALFLVAGVIAGMSQGAAFTASLRRLVAQASPAERAGMLATIYLISYAGAAIPNFIAGQFSIRVDLTGIAAGYSVLVVLAAVIAIVFTFREASAAPHSDADTSRVPEFSDAWRATTTRGSRRS
ncbi:MFS transporter [Gordonia sp. HNM0687]|uniref:MFS transporter n=1 Tax=Gordonia mangrovi TaxID=2665643 RepID=A0A6L7GWP9_9ACTN|nr:MFS transporter [Gordonia mangrovi]MXP23441.1 MFS transporter [Gordonia mangrovi]UVF76664.1 MFS transporter [Gordonia mangrovi]